MTLQIPPDLSVLVSVWMETLVYGIYVVLFMMAMVSLSRHKNAAIYGTPIRVAMLIMFSVSTTHLGINLRRLIEGFVNTDSNEEMMAYFYDIDQPLNIVKQFLLVITNILADGIIVWRLLVIWNSWVCILPVVLLIGTSACGLAVGITLATMTTAGESMFLNKLSSYITAQYSLSLFNNILVTSLIAGRILHIGRGVSRMMDHPGYRRVCLILIESGAFYAVTQILLLGFYVARFPGIYFISDTINQIMCIVPTAMILLVAVNREAEQNSTSSDGSHNPVKFAHFARNTEDIIKLENFDITQQDSWTAIHRAVDKPRTTEIAVTPR